MTVAESKLIKTIESDEGTTRIYENGLLESIIKEGAYIDVPYLIEGKRLIEKFLPGQKIFVLTESLGFYRISREARELSASKEYSSHISAVAVVTKSVSTKLIFDLYSKIDKPVVPTKAYTDRHDAYLWLQEMMNQ